MKKLFQIILLLLLFTTQCKSQFWCEPQAKWTFGWTSAGPWAGILEVTCGNDTIVDGVNCKSLIGKNIRYSYIPQTFDTTYYIVGYYFETDSILFFSNRIYGSDYSREFDTLYNFKAGIGDSWTINQIPLGPDIFGLTPRCDSLMIVNVVDTGHITIGSENLYYLAVEYDIPTWDSVVPYRDTIFQNLSMHLSWGLYCCSVALDYELYDFRCYNDYQISFISNEQDCNYIAGVGIAETEKALLKISPVPANDFLNIQLLDNLRNAEIRIQDLSGQLVFKSDASTTLSTTENNQKLTVDVSSFANGIYLLTVFNSEKIATMKMVVQH